MRIKTTQYGYPNDEDGDTLTKEGWGCWGNKLTAAGCALTKSAENLLGATKLCWLKITYSTGVILYRQWQDRAPEADDRLDLYQPQGFDKTLPDYADVVLAPQYQPPVS